METSILSFGKFRNYFKTHNQTADMKVIYEIKNTSEFLNQLNLIAQKYGAHVSKQDEGPGHFIFIKSRLKIAGKLRDNKQFAYVWGATEEDLSFLNSFWGEPNQVIELKMTPLEFASELIEIPQAEALTVEEIIQIMKITERDFKQYTRYIKMASRKSDISEDVKRANTILEQL